MPPTGLLGHTPPNAFTRTPTPNHRPSTCIPPPITAPPLPEYPHLVPLADRLPQPPPSPPPPHPLPPVSLSRAQLTPFSPHPPPLNLNIPHLRYLLSNHPDPAFASSLLHDLEHGVRICHHGTPSNRVAPNLPTTPAMQATISTDIAKEVELGHIRGPFTRAEFLSLFPSFTCSPIGAVAKNPPSVGFRRIHHLSWPRHTHASVNDHIHYTEDLHYITPAHVCSTIRTLGPGTFLAVIDIQSAFRLQPVHPLDQPLLAFHWLDSFYVDTRLPFGLRSSPVLWERIASTLAWLAHHLGVTHLHHYVDDFLIAAPSAALCQAHLDLFLSLCSFLNVPVSRPKLQGPHTTVTYLGVEFDTLRMEARIPPVKLALIASLTDPSLHPRTITLRELQTICGKLLWCSHLVPPGRTFTQRLLHLLRDKERQLRPHHHFRFPAEARADLAAWHSFLFSWNGTRLLSTPPSLTCATDASGTVGIGGHWEDEWFAFSWTDAQLSSLSHFSPFSSLSSSSFIELLAIAVALSIWGPTWHHSHARVLCDNQGAVAALASRTSPQPSLSRLLRHITSLEMTHHLTLSATYLPGPQNALADALSRGQWARARSLRPSLAPTPSPLPTWLSTCLIDPLS